MSLLAVLDVFFPGRSSHVPERDIARKQSHLCVDPFFGMYVANKIFVSVSSITSKAMVGSIVITPKKYVTNDQVGEILQFMNIEHCLLST